MHIERTVTGTNKLILYYKGGSIDIYDIDLFNKYLLLLRNIVDPDNKIFDRRLLYCIKCSKSYKDIREYDRHIKRPIHLLSSTEYIEYKEKRKNDEESEEYGCICKPCGFKTNYRSHYERHINTRKHMKAIKEEIKYKYICEKCDMKTNRKDTFNSHLLSEKHAIIHNIYHEKNNKYSCKPCNHYTNMKTRHERHMKTEMHNKKINEKNDEKNELIFQYRCDKCNFKSNRKDSYEIHLKSQLHLLDEKDYKKFKSDNGYKSLKTGESTEEYIYNMYLKLDPDIEDVKWIGSTGSIFDIKIKYKNECKYRGIQVKTLSKDPDYRPEAHYISGCKKYPDNCVIICVDSKREKFAILTGKDADKSSIKIHTNWKNKNKDKLYTDDKEFKHQVKLLSRQSTIIDNDLDYLYYTQQIEYNSMLRLEVKCIEFKLQFQKNLINSNVEDCKINNYTIQCKASTYMNGSGYSFNIVKSINQIKVPYSETDKIDFFIFESIVDNKNTTFYIIPMKKLIKWGYIKTDTQKGRAVIIMYNKDGTNRCKTHKYINKFDLLEK